MCLMQKSKNGRTIIFCLEDLLNFVKEGGTVIRGNEAKRARGSKFSRSSSRSVQYRCHVGICFHILLFSDFNIYLFIYFLK